MGYLKSIGTTIIYIGAFMAAITFIPGIPPDASKFNEYSIVSPKELTDSLAPNGRLNDPEILFQGQVKGAEAFASYNGELYSGVHGGQVVKITKNKIIPIAKFGEDCDGLWQESKCGRPLGMKFDKKGTLYVCDAYYGIFKVDVKTGKYERIVNSKEPIEGKIPLITNTLDIASNGDIYWSDSSTDYTLQDGAYTMLANPSGRLIRYNAATKKNQVLVHDLGFANGVALSANEDFVIVAETLMSRITKYNIKGPNAGKSEIFIEGLPGLPDNIHSDNNNGFLVGLVTYADQEHPLLSQSLTPHPYIRRMFARLLTLLEAPFQCLQTYYPNEYFEKIIHYVGGFESVLFITPKTVTILRIDDKGKIVEAAYNNDEKVTGISSAYIHDGYLWLGSPWIAYIARVPVKQVFPQLSVQEKKESNTVKAEKLEEKNIPNVSGQQTTQKPTTKQQTTQPPTTKQQKPSSTAGTTRKPEPPKTTTQAPPSTKKTTKEQKSSQKDRTSSSKP